MLSTSERAPSGNRFDDVCTYDWSLRWWFSFFELKGHVRTKFLHESNSFGGGKSVESGSKSSRPHRPIATHACILNSTFLIRTTHHSTVHRTVCRRQSICHGCTTKCGSETRALRCSPRGGGWSRKQEVAHGRRVSFHRRERRFLRLDQRVQVNTTTFTALLQEMLTHLTVLTIAHTDVFVSDRARAIRL